MKLLAAISCLLTAISFGESHTATGDFDNDSHQDLVLIDLTSGFFTLGFGDSGGEFIWQESRPIPHSTGQATGKRQHKPFAVYPSSDGGADSLAFSHYAKSRVSLLHGNTNRSRSLRSIDDFTVEVGPLGIATAQIDASSPDEELLVPLLALPSPQTASFVPLAGSENFQHLPNGAIDPSLSGALTDFAILAPDQSNSNQGRHEDHHLAAYNFLLEIDGLAASQVRLIRLTGANSNTDHIFHQPADQILSANMRGPDQPGQIIMWGQGLDSLAVLTVSEGAGNTIGIEDLVIQHEGIERVEKIETSKGVDQIAVIHDDGDALTIYSWDSDSKEITTDQSITPPFGSGKFLSVSSLGNGFFALLDDHSFANYALNGSGEFELANQGPVPLLKLASSKATVMLYTDDPLSGNAFEFNSYAVDQWARDANYAGGQIHFISETFESASQGLGDPQAMTVNPTANPGGSAKAQGNQFGDASSSIFFAGDLIDDGLAATSISPPAGDYDAPIRVQFSSSQIGSTIIYRINNQPWKLDNGKGFFLASDSTIEFYGQSPGGSLGAIQSASYQFNLAFGLDSNDDLLPDDVAVAFGLDPFGNSDSDGDGFSDANEILNSSDPRSPLSTPEELSAQLPPPLSYDVLINVPQNDNPSQDVPVPGAILTVFQPDGASVIPETPMINGEATVQNSAWYEDFDSSQSGQRSDFALAQVSTINFPPIPGDLNEPRGASMFGLALPPNHPLPQLPPPTPGPVPTPYPSTAQLSNWVDRTTEALASFDKVVGLDGNNDPIIFNADTTLAVAAFTVWSHQQLSSHGALLLKFPWEATSGRTAVTDSDLALLEEPQGAGHLAHELTPTIQQIHHEITHNPDYLPLRNAVREMIHVDLYLVRKDFSGHIWNSGQALINFFEEGELDPFYAAEVSTSLPTLQTLRSQLLDLPTPRPTLSLSGDLVRQEDNSWAITSGGELYPLFSSTKIPESFTDGVATFHRQPFTIGNSDLLNGVQQSQVHLIGFPFGEGNDIEVHSLSILSVNLTNGENDLDQDGLDDSFEFYFLGNLDSSFWQDSDGDGFSDGEEYRQGTNPDEPQSFPASLPALPAYLSIDRSIGEVTLTWKGSSAAIYTVETGDLTTWTPAIQSPVEISPGLFEWITPITPERLSMFRVVVSFP